MITEAEYRPDQASAQGLNVPAIGSSQKGQRIPALDFTKGTLVLIMVLYHWINYFIGNQWRYYLYLRFLTPSFIFITGFMVSHVYLSRYATADPRLWKRLVTRGMKLTAIFLGLNVARTVVALLLGTGEVHHGLPSLANLFAIFISGNLPTEGAKIVSFPILLPISYLLMLAGGLMLPLRSNKYAFYIATTCLLLFIVTLGVLHERSYNLEFIAIGMLGVLIGYTPTRIIDNIGRYPYWLALFYLGYLAAITRWNVPFVLLFVGVLLNLSIIYLIGARGRTLAVFRAEVILLGRYSLVGYISQVAILQFLSAGSRRLKFESGNLLVSFILAFVLTLVSVGVVDRARSTSPNVDRLYRALFA